MLRSQIKKMDSHFLFLKDAFNAIFFSKMDTLHSNITCVVDYRFICYIDALQINFLTSLCWRLRGNNCCSIWNTTSSLIFWNTTSSNYEFLNCYNQAHILTHFPIFFLDSLGTFTIGSSNRKIHWLHERIFTKMLHNQTTFLVWPGSRTAKIYDHYL